MVSCANDGRELKENYKLFRKWALEDFRAEEIFCELRQLWPDWEITKEESNVLYQSYVERSTDLRLWPIYQQIMAFDTPEGAERIVQLLRSWGIEVSLSAEQEMFFVGEVLRPYLSHMIRLPLEKEAAGHYRSEYRIVDYEFCEEYRIRRNKLNEIKASIELPSTKEYKSFLEMVSNLSLDSQNRSAEHKQLNGKIEEICAATIGYLKSTRSGAERVARKQVKRIIAQVSEQIGDMNLFPMAYLMVCVAGTSKLFSSNMSIKGKIIAGACEKPYHQKPAAYKQRIARIQLLSELMRCCDIEKDGQKENWGLFFRIHGERITSLEEIKLWTELKEKQPEQWMRRNLPVIELQMMRNEFMKDCFPVFPEYLLSYRGGSVWQLGGFAAFLHKHPEVLEECVRRIQGRDVPWNDIRKSYLKCWGALSYDLIELREICLRASRHINLAQILRKHAVDLQVFIDDMDTRNAVSDRADLDELKQLLVELAIRKTLAEDAKARLGCVMTQLMNAAREELREGG